MRKWEQKFFRRERETGIENNRSRVTLFDIQKIFFLTFISYKISYYPIVAQVRPHFDCVKALFFI